VRKPRGDIDEEVADEVPAVLASQSAYFSKSSLNTSRKAGWPFQSSISCMRIWTT